MGKLSRSQVISRALRVAEGRDPYVKRGIAATPKGKTSSFLPTGSTGHPGSKRPDLRLRKGQYVFHCPGCHRSYVLRRHGEAFDCASCHRISVLP